MPCAPTARCAILRPVNAKPSSTVCSRTTESVGARPSAPRVLLIRLDAIGDYVLFRNVLRFIRHSAAYRSAHLTVLGNPSWRNLAETYDQDCADEWLWVEHRNDLFRKSIENLVPRTVWHHRVAHAQAAFRAPLLQRHFDEVLSLQPIRDPLLDELVAGLAPSVVGLRGPGDDDSAYTRLLDGGTHPFVFLRNRCAASDLTGESCDVPLALDLQEPKAAASRLMLFPGASHWTKRWPLSRFAAVGRRFLANGGGSVCVAGGPADAARISALARRIGNAGRVTEWNWRCPLPDLAAEMAKCMAIVTNDTMALHLAAAVGTPAVGIVNGVTGRDGFWPYPDSLGKRVIIVGTTGKIVEQRSLSLAVRQFAHARNLLAVDTEEVCHALVDLGVPF